MTGEGSRGHIGSGGRGHGECHGRYGRDFDWIPYPGMQGGLGAGGLENLGPSIQSPVEQWGRGCNVVVVLMAWEPVGKGNE